MNETAKMIRFYKSGGPEVLKIEDVRRPKPVGNEERGAGNGMPGRPAASAGEYRRREGQRLRHESPTRSFA